MEKAQALMAAAQAKCLNLAQRIYVEKAALSVEFAAVGQQILQGNVDTARIDRMMDMGRTLGIVRISEGPEWNMAYRGMLDGKLYR